MSTIGPNAHNQITSMTGPRPQVVQGYTNEPSNVTINGTRADNANHNQFTGSIDATPGANTITATATDISANANTTTQCWDIDVPETQPLSYDANGNMLSDGTRSYTWDAANRLISVSMGIDTRTFGYDSLDRRVIESKNGTLMKKWLWCGTSICEERAPNEAVTKRYFTHGEERVGDWNAGEYFYTTDHLGRKTSGQAVKKENEGMRYRDLEASVFLTRDPAGFVDGPNVYTYVKQNPWSAFDPLGLADVQSHHMFPQQLITNFSASGVNVHQNKRPVRQ